MILCLFETATALTIDEKTDSLEAGLCLYNYNTSGAYAGMNLCVTVASILQPNDFNACNGLLLEAKVIQ